MRARLPLFRCFFALALSCTAPAWLHAADAENSSTAAEEARLKATVTELASDTFEGRGVGTHGLDMAAALIAEQFKAIGLKTDLYAGTPFQKFTMVTGAELTDNNSASFVGPAPKEGEKPEVIDLKLGQDFNPLALGESGEFNLPLVFVGYGITAKDEKYDDYADVDVKDKAVIVLRHEPQQDNPHSAFEGTENSLYAPYSRKLSNAYEHGAAAVIFCTDDYEIRHRIEERRKRWQQAQDELSETQKKYAEIAEPTDVQLEEHRGAVEKLAHEIIEQGQKLRDEYDPVVPFEGAGPGDESGHIPVIHVRREPLVKLVRAALGESLADLEHKIDEGPTPHSLPLPGWNLRGEVSLNRRHADVMNVVGVLEGEGPHADETIVIGAHYDHLGFGGAGSLAPESKEIHNGADDNGSGTAALIEVARRLATLGHKLPRRIVFIAFTGEERGLIGSARYCKDPLVPLDKTLAMLNMDMVGRLSDDKLIVQGVDTGTGLTELIDRLNERYAFELVKQKGGFGPSDHASFYGFKIPVLHFFTGIHADYHRPSDDSDKLNIEGMRRVADFVADTAIGLAEADEPTKYLESKRVEPAMGGGGDRPYFGSIPDFGQTDPGYAISGVAKDSPAAKAGLQAGDVIIGLGESRIGSLNDFDSALRKHKGGDKVPVKVRRGGQEVTLTVTLDPPR